jgi:acyl-CoA thioester hydrolase
MQGLVFNAHWLSYFDEAAMRFFERIGHTPSHPVDDFTASVVKAVIEWKGPAGLEDQIGVALRASRLGTASFDLHFLAEVGGRGVCEATITYVSVDRSSARSRPIPPTIRTALQD